MELPAASNAQVEERDDGDDKGGDENAGEEYYGFRPICRLAWHKDVLAVARFSQLQLYSAMGTFTQGGHGPILPIPNTAGALINSIQWSQDGTRILVAYDDKKLVMLDTAQWKPAFTKELTKKATAACLTSKSPYRIIYADKQGEIWILPPGDAAGDGEFLMGHVSMVTDILLPADEAVILTADRDEKIRVSRFPQAQIIENYCLGHSQFVSRLLIHPAMRRGTVISGSGDCTLRLWNYFTGKLLSTCTREGVGEVALIPVAYYNSNNIAVIEAQAPGDSKVAIYRMNSDNIERVNEASADNRVQDAAYDDAGTLWIINDTGMITAYPASATDAGPGKTLCTLLKDPAQAVAPPEKVRRSRLSKKKVDEEPVVIAPAASSLPAYVRKALGAERPQYQKKDKGEKRKEEEKDQ